MDSASSSTWMWYASRATGVVALLLLTAVALLGLMVSRQARLAGLPRFAVTGLHRNLSLLAIAFLLAHVLTAVADRYVTIPLDSAVIPFTSGYERLWLGIGAVSADLFLAVIITSLLRRHLRRRAWYAVHLLSYASWPIAFAHSLGSSGDMQAGWMLLLALACAAALATGIIWRVRAAARDLPRAQRVQALMAELHARKPRAGAR
jgi:methionine sulfoxide reductase heme-binding subunit